MIKILTTKKYKQLEESMQNGLRLVAALERENKHIKDVLHDLYVETAHLTKQE